MLNRKPFGLVPDNIVQKSLFTSWASHQYMATSLSSGMADWRGGDDVELGCVRQGAQRRQKQATLVDPCKVTSPAGKPFVGILAEEDFDGEFGQALLVGQLARMRLLCKSCRMWLVAHKFLCAFRRTAFLIVVRI